MLARERTELEKGSQIPLLMSTYIFSYGKATYLDNSFNFLCFALDTITMAHEFVAVYTYLIHAGIFNKYNSSILGGRVANKLVCNAIGHGFASCSFGDISEIHFLESIQSPAQKDLKWSLRDIVGIQL